MTRKPVKPLTLLRITVAASLNLDLVVIVEVTVVELTIIAAMIRKMAKISIDIFGAVQYTPWIKIPYKK
jgi:hypothetical protein